MATEQTESYLISIADLVFSQSSQLIQLSAQSPLDVMPKEQGKRGWRRTCSEAACSYIRSNVSQNQSLNTIKIFQLGFQMFTMLIKCGAAPVAFVKTETGFNRELDPELQ